MTLTAHKRRPRFKRVATRSFRLTARDFQIIEHVANYRLLNSEHIEKLLGGGGSSQHLRRRLQLLYHARFLDRPRIQVTSTLEEPGSSPMVYALGNKGASLLAEARDVSVQSVDWTSKNRKIRTIFLRHRLMISSVMVAFEASCREHGDVRVIPFEEILDRTCPPETRRLKRPQSFRVSLPGGKQLGITPDAIFGLHFFERPQGKNRTYFFLEADRGTMPVKRKTLNQSGIYKKLITYHAAALQGVHTRRFGFKNVRVLTVTKSPDRKRVKSMVAACRTLRGLQGMFLFTDEDSLVAGDVLGHGWVDGRGDKKVLLTQGRQRQEGGADERRD